MIRKFSLRNEYGQIYDLNHIETGFLYSPDGLGYELDSSYSKAGSSFVRNYLEDKQSEITGTMVFGGSKPYLAQNKFTQWVNAAAALSLIYETDTGTYRRDIDLVSVSKSEVDESKTLQCSVRMTCKSLFYSDSTDVYRVERVDGEFRYDVQWPARFRDYENRQMLISNDGHVPAPFTIEIWGYLENPKMSVKQNGAEISKVKFPVTIEKGECLRYSSIDGDIYAYKIGTDGAETNLNSLLDIENANFFKLPIGSCEFNLTGDTEVVGKTLMVVYRYYRVV